MPSMPSGLAESIVVFLSQRPDDLARFLALTGHDAGNLRGALNRPHFRAGLVDYLASNEPLLLAFCEETGHDPRRVAALTQDEAPWD